MAAALSRAELSLTSASPGSDDASGHELRLFAALIALTILVIAARTQILRIAHLSSHYPLLFYQDVFALAILAWVFRGFFRIARSDRAQRVVAILGLTLCLIGALYTAIATMVFWLIRSPLTYRLIVISDGARGVQASIREDLSLSALALPGDVLLVAGLGALIWRYTPALLRRAHRGCYSLSGAALVIVYLVGAHLWVTRNVRFMPGVENPEWAFIESLIKAPRPTVSANIPPDYFADFHAVLQPAGGARASAFAGLPIPGAAAKPLNVILFVMESVGAKNLQLTGAPYADSPRLMKLAQHGMVYDNAYVAQPFTSSAMAGLFASLYPDHDWLTIPRKEPTIKVPGLPAVLNAHGYRTAFIDAGLIDYDGNLSFLESMGFADLIGRPADDIQPRDGELVPAAFNWINRDRAQPFFVAIWTRDTHNPYLSYSNHKYSGNWVKDRYLNSIAWTDQVIGQLSDELKRTGLADNTLLVITGDHGEAFEEHGQSVHNFSVYNEEVRVPLMFVNDKLFPHRLDEHVLARQLDIAPTILDTLGIEQPASWQGTSLFAAHRPSRAYLFSIAGDFRLGLAEDDYVYIQNYTRDRHELYNVKTDFDERNDLSAVPAFAPMIKRDHLRLDAWLDFQNNYLGSFACPRCPIPHHSPTSLEDAAAQNPPSR
jgi:glucan phosphoethanolaminetransferase (alkaline phosphatase superfamily)